MYIDITSFVNSNNNEENGNFLKRKSSAVLPQLKSRIDFVKDSDHSDWNVTDSTQNTYLPILGKAKSAKTLSKQLDNECKLLSIISFISNNSLRFILIHHIEL